MTAFSETASRCGPKHRYGPPSPRSTSAPTRFIGSPAMNLVGADVERGDGGPYLCFGPHRLAVSEKAVKDHPALERYLGKKVVFGIRPEHMEDASLSGDATPGSVLDVSVELREELGSEVDLHCAVGVAPLHPAELGDDETGEVADVDPVAGPERAAGADHAAIADPSDAAAPAGSALASTIVARMDPRTTLQVGERARVKVDLAALHFFDPATGASLRS